MTMKEKRGEMVSPLLKDFLEKQMGVVKFWREKDIKLKPLSDPAKRARDEIFRSLGIKPRSEVSA